MGACKGGDDDKTHEIIGTTFKPSQKMVGNNELENWLIQNLTPHIDFRIYEFQCDGKDIAIFEIPAAENEPVDYKRVPYIRVGSITRKLSEFPNKERCDKTYRHASLLRYDGVTLSTLSGWGNRKVDNGWVNC